ncbi:hypothetical protein ACWFQ8_31970 [Streptomyces sp. NPDC055254]
MARHMQTLVFGAAFILLLAGCESGGTPDGESPSKGIGIIPLAEMETISVADDPLADMDGPIKILSELKFGQERLIAYVRNDSCGILATSKNQPTVNQIHLVSKWPSGGEGSNRYPQGPYNSASGVGDPKIWASLLCGKNAMVIEYSSGHPGAPEQARGPVTVAQVTHHPVTSRIIVGDPVARQQIEGPLKESGVQAHTPPAG